MKTFNTKILGIIIGILIVANIATLTFFWVTKKADIVHQGRGEGAATFLIKELAFDSSQIETFSHLKQQHQQAMRGIKPQVEQAKEAYFTLLTDSTVTEQTIKEAATKVSVIEQQIDLITFQHLQKVRSICKPAQQKKFDEIIIQVIRMMGRQGPPPPRKGNGEEKEETHLPEGEGFPPPPEDNEPH